MVCRLLTAAVLLGSIVAAQESQPATRPQSRPSKPPVEEKTAKPAPAPKPEPRATPTAVDPLNLREGQVFRISRETPALPMLVFLLIEQDPVKNEKLEKKTDKLGAGSTFLISEVRVVKGTKYYVVGSFAKEKPKGSKDFYMGVIKSTWLKGQKIEVVE